MQFTDPPNQTIDAWYKKYLALNHDYEGVLIEKLFGFDCYPIRRTCFGLARDILEKEPSLATDTKTKLLDALYESFGFD